MLFSHKTFYCPLYHHELHQTLQQLANGQLQLGIKTPNEHHNVRSWHWIRKRMKSNHKTYSNEQVSRCTRLIELSSMTPSSPSTASIQWPFYHSWLWLSFDLRAVLFRRERQCRWPPFERRTDEVGLAWMTAPGGCWLSRKHDSPTPEDWRWVPAERKLRCFRSYHRAYLIMKKTPTQYRVVYSRLRASIVFIGTPKARWENWRRAQGLMMAMTQGLMTANDWMTNANMNLQKNNASL